jgi:hypothetical protein
MRLSISSRRRRMTAKCASLDWRLTSSLTCLS